MHQHSFRAFAGLDTARYARLHSFRRDGTPGDELPFRTKVGPKTIRVQPA
jgi:hypothetical protein